MNTHHDAPRSRDLPAVIGWAVCSAAALAAAWASYDFGALLGGPLLGLMAALNGAAMGALLASALTARLLPSRR